MLEVSSKFLGLPVAVNGRAETRGHCSSTQMIYCVPIKHRGNLCFEHNTSQVRVPNQLLLLSQTTRVHISSADTQHSFEFTAVGRSFYLPVADNFGSF